MAHPYLEEHSTLAGLMATSKEVFWEMHLTEPCRRGLYCSSLIWESKKELQQQRRNYLTDTFSV